MAVGQRTWCDIVIITNKDINVERVLYNEEYWMNTLHVHPKRESFFDNCLGPEIISPIHAPGHSLHDLSDMHWQLSINCVPVNQN